MEEHGPGTHLPMSHLRHECANLFQTIPSIPPTCLRAALYHHTQSVVVLLFSIFPVMGSGVTLEMSEEI